MTEATGRWAAIQAMASSTMLRPRRSAKAERRSTTARVSSDSGPSFGFTPESRVPAGAAGLAGIFR